jgi:hypothetical protein
MPYSLKATDVIFASHPSSISQVFNMPLVIRALRVEDVPELGYYLQEMQVPNMPIRSLFRQCKVTCCDATAGHYGWDRDFGKATSHIEGSVILARCDQKSLHPVQAQMILEYVETKVEPAFEEYHVERKRWKKRLDAAEYREKVDEMRGEVEALAKETTMRAEWQKFKELHGHVCSSVSSPWDV